MNIFRIFRRESSAPTARERLQVLLSHERLAGDPSDLVTLLRGEIVAVIARHVNIDPEKVVVTMDRGPTVSVLEIDVEIPLQQDMKAA
ncbi:cell division topological specificity factor MinE [Ciceribacter sp. L1K23]|uniref:cell division topological specificity factor MinE n=1 Tax=Ciceribacter sp. L1K23 TaxID=2820276 RepID=UPI001B82A649|nr:cell division topological specificity factor MinE [Ciceribacter sp. L1K23]MBR0556306.1 cell division topological specificity factor MinE [Ciceribacter sp. L1K23]